MSVYTKVCRETDKQLACEGEKLDRHSVMRGGILQVRTRKGQMPTGGSDVATGSCEQRPAVKSILRGLLTPNIL
jgi:hypothetical protein